MAKSKTKESDEGRLKKKIAERQKTVENAEGDAAFRTLKKRLKRVQRKRRADVIRRRHAAGKAGAAESKSGAASPSS